MNKKITFVFLSGRRDKLKTNEAYAKEFFYGYHHIKSKYQDTKIIEFSNSIDSIFDKFLRKISDLPFFTSRLENKENRKRFSESDSIILTNQRVGFSMLRTLVYIKLFKKIKVTVFIMGLFNKKTNYLIKDISRKILIRFLIILTDNFIFLSKGEYLFAENKYSTLKNKFHFIPFAVDIDFWNKSEKNLPNNNILFIGNDGQRDYEFVIELAKNLPKYEFTFVTKQIKPEDLKSDNIKLINGSWGNVDYSDNFIHNLYLSSFASIIPLKNTLQPSGQSVALQSMASGTPVLITETNGFWEPDKFFDRKNIVFVKENNIEEWVDKLNFLYNDENFAKNISNSARDTVAVNNNLSKFNDQLIKLL